METTQTTLETLVNAIPARPTVVIYCTYRLTPAGQKADLMAGGSGKREQILELATSDSDLVEEAHIDANGRLSVSFLYYRPDEVEAMDENIASSMIRARRAQRLADAEASRRRWREASEKLLASASVVDLDACAEVVGRLRECLDDPASNPTDLYDLAVRALNEAERARRWQAEEAAAAAYLASLSPEEQVIAKDGYGNAEGNYRWRVERHRAKLAERAAMVEWAAAHDRDDLMIKRLSLALAEGIDCGSLYRDTRYAMEIKPTGWVRSPEDHEAFTSDSLGSSQEVHSPTVEALEVLRAARAEFEAVAIEWRPAYHHDPDSDDADQDGDVRDGGYYVLSRPAPDWLVTDGKKSLYYLVRKG